MNTNIQRTLRKLSIKTFSERFCASRVVTVPCILRYVFAWSTSHILKKESIYFLRTLLEDTDLKVLVLWAFINIGDQIVTTITKAGDIIDKKSGIFA